MELLMEPQLDDRLRQMAGDLDLTPDAVAVLLIQSALTWSIDPQ